MDKQLTLDIDNLILPFLNEIKSKIFAYNNIDKIKTALLGFIKKRNDTDKKLLEELNIRQQNSIFKDLKGFIIAWSKTSRLFIKSSSSISDKKQAPRTR